MIRKNVFSCILAEWLCACENIDFKRLLSVPENHETDVITDILLNDIKKLKKHYRFLTSVFAIKLEYSHQI